MAKEWNIQQLEKHIASGARQLVIVGVVLMAIVLSSGWIQEWLSLVAVLVVLLLLIVFIFIKLLQVVRWQQRIYEMRRKK